MGQRAFVSGVAGFLGSHLAEHLSKSGWDVSGIDNLSNGARINIPDSVLFKSADCLDTSEYRDLLQGCDIVYHCAAYAYEGLSSFAPQVVHQNTCTSAIALCAAAANQGAKRFVLCSSMARYGAQRTPFEETMSPRPVDPYGVAKVAAEMSTTMLSEVHGMESCVAVPHNVYGPRQRYDDPYRNVVSIMANRMLRGDQPIIYGDGRQIRCFTYVIDAVSALAAMATSDKVCKEVINIGPDERETSIDEIAQLIADVIGFKLAPIYVEARPLEVHRATCSSAKARDLLGYTTSISLEEGIKRTVDYIQRQGPREFRYSVNLEILTGATPRIWRNQRI